MWFREKGSKERHLFEHLTCCWWVSQSDAGGGLSQLFTMFCYLLTIRNIGVTPSMNKHVVKKSKRINQGMNMYSKDSYRTLTNCAEKSKQSEIFPNDAHWKHQVPARCSDTAYMIVGTVIICDLSTWRNCKQLFAKSICSMKYFICWGAQSCALSLCVRYDDVCFSKVMYMWQSYTIKRIIV